MIVVLTAREGGVSKYILYEMSLCLRARKPVLVFIEDTLPDGLVPPRVLQRRFSRKGYLRQIRELRYAVQIFKTYLGETPPPMYQPSLKRRSCLFVGVSSLKSEVKKEMFRQVEELSYESIIVDMNNINLAYDIAQQETIISANLAICLVDSTQSSSHYLLGVIHTSLTPTIRLTGNPNYRFHPDVPIEYQPRIVDYLDIPSLREMIKTEVSIFEEEYVDLDNQQEVSKYADLLIQEASSIGKYTESVRKIFVNELIMESQ